MVRPIVRLGDRALHQPAQPVPAIDHEVQRLIDDMLESMYAARGIGLAAPQLGVPLRLFVVDLSLGRSPDDVIVMINPEWVSRDGMQLEEEGCLSVPGFTASVARPAVAIVKGLDRTGAERTVEGRGLLARAFQHEMDHLDGRLFVDHLRGIRREQILRKVQKLRRAGEW